LLIFTAKEEHVAARDVALTLSPHRLLSTSPLAGVKSTAMLETLLAMEEARARRFDDAVMLNERGEIVCTTTANIFWSEGDELFTPSVATGCVAGVTRHFVCEIARRLRINLVEGSYPVQRLRSAREVFLVSTARLIVPVASFDITAYRRPQASMTRILAGEYNKLLHES
jgi:branched-subunit amino acid aminotransferase/4-amino-4-deoxychorismate lyase